MPLLNDFLSSFHLNATIFHRSLVCDAWSTDTSGSGMASFHLISSGTAYLHTEGYRGEALNKGDIVIFPHDAPHIMSYSQDDEIARNTESFVAYPIEQDLATSSETGSRPNDVKEPFPKSTGLICGNFDFGIDKQHPVIKQLPNCILIRNQEQQGALKGLIQGLIDEALLGSQATDAILGRMSELFFLTLLRNLAQDNSETLGFFRALKDPKMAKVLTAIQQELAKPWSLISLAEVGGFSRASFASHFKAYLGTSPLDYLTRLRLTSAQKRLQAGDSVYQVAIEVGYQNDVSFAKAYKRHFGFGPGVTRASGLPTGQNET